MSEKERNCTKCGRPFTPGWGYTKGSPLDLCNDCGYKLDREQDKGEVKLRNAIYYEDQYPTGICGPCGGTGKVHGYICTQCRGLGRISSKKELKEEFKKKFDKEYGGDRLCFITTACIEAQALPDNCLELRTLRRFRDIVIAKNKEGRREIQIYYQEASKIIEAINKKEDAMQIWNNVYKEIVKAVDMVLKQDFQGAYEHYKKNFLKLKNLFS